MYGQAKSPINLDKITGISAILSWLVPVDGEADAVDVGIFYV